jgi:hypothetical protein
MTITCFLQTVKSSQVQPHRHREKNLSLPHGKRMGRAAEKENPNAIVRLDIPHSASIIIM